MDAWWVGDGDERIGGAERGAESGAYSGTYYHGIRRRHHIGFRLQYGDPGLFPPHKTVDAEKYHIEYFDTYMEY